MEELLKILKDLRPEVDFTKEQNLIDDGILDSFDIITLVSDLDDVFQVNIMVEHLVPENFNTPDAIMNLIQSLTE